MESPTDNDPGRDVRFPSGRVEPHPAPATVGRIVHYYDHMQVGPLAAIVTEVPHPFPTRPGHSEAPQADLLVFTPGSAVPTAISSVPGTYSPQPSSWTWPPRA